MTEEAPGAGLAREAGDLPPFNLEIEEYREPGSARVCRFIGKASDVAEVAGRVLSSIGDAVITAGALATVVAFVRKRLYFDETRRSTSHDSAVEPPAPIDPYSTPTLDESASKLFEADEIETKRIKDAMRASMASRAARRPVLIIEAENIVLPLPNSERNKDLGPTELGKAIRDTGSGLIELGNALRRSVFSGF
jgi:hypothetical protein